MSHYQKLICDLTEEEVSNYSNELARLITEQGEVEAEKKEVMSDFAAKINKIIADSRVLSRKVTTRKEERQVECDYEYDYIRGVVFTVRMDTGVTIGQRKLTDEERQERLDFEGEQDSLQEAEDIATEGTEEPLTSIQDDSGESEITFCINTDCSHNDKTEPNGCTQFEYVCECKEAAGAAGKDKESSSYATIQLDPSFFADGGPLKKAFPPQAGVPDDGKLKKIFTLEDRIFYLIGASFDGNGYKDVDAYELIKRDEWTGDTSTLKDHLDEYHRQETYVALSYTGCIVVHKSIAYVIGDRIMFIHTSSEVKKPELSDDEKDAICHEWRDCGYTEECFAQSNMEAERGICFKDEAAKA